MKTLEKAAFAYNHLRTYVGQQVHLRTGINVSKPTTVNVLLTLRCTARCVMCTHWFTKEEELTTEQWKEFFAELIDGLGPYTKINVSGGEPFVRKDILEILGFATSRSNMVGVISNGFAMKKDLARKVMDLGLFNTNVSIDGLEETHNRLRGAPWAFEKSTAALQNLREAKLELGAETKIILKTIIMGANVHELKNMVQFTERYGLDGILFQPLEQTLGENPRDPFWYEKDPNWIKDLDEMYRTMDDLIQMKQEGWPILNSAGHLELLKTYFRDPETKGQGRCEVGVTSFDVAPSGWADLCFKKKPIGNMTNISPRDLWHSIEAKSMRENEIDPCTQLCLLTCQVKRPLRDKVGLFVDLMMKSDGKKDANC